MTVVHLSDYRPLPPDATGEQRLDAWALEILRRDPAAWIIPSTFSMRAPLDRLWVNGRADKKWIDGRNAYRLRDTAQPPHTGATP